MLSIYCHYCFRTFYLVPLKWGTTQDLLSLVLSGFSQCMINPFHLLSLSHSHSHSLRHSLSHSSNHCLDLSHWSSIVIFSDQCSLSILLSHLWIKVCHFFLIFLIELCRISIVISRRNKNGFL